jgi:hypothetical protein
MSLRADSNILLILTFRESSTPFTAKLLPDKVQQVALKARTCRVSRWGKQVANTLSAGIRLLNFWCLAPNSQLSAKSSQSSRGEVLAPFLPYVRNMQGAYCRQTGRRNIGESSCVKCLLRSQSAPYWPS